MTEKLVNPDLLAVLEKLEEGLWRAEMRFNDRYMDNVFAPDFFEFGRSGKRYERADMFLGSQKHTEIMAKFPLRNFAARYLAYDVVQTTYVSEVTYGERVEYANRSSIWTRSSNEWLLRFHQGTPTDPS